MEEIQILISSFKGFSKHTGKSKLTDKLLEIGSYTNGRIIEKIRALVRDGKKEEAALVKKQLKGSTLSATYKERRVPEMIDTYNDLQMMDLDGLSEEEMTNCRKLITGSPNTLFCFTSPSGNGLKVGVYMQDELSCRLRMELLRRSEISYEALETYHKQMFAYAKEYYETLCSVEVDASGSDIGRLFFTSYDPDIYICEEALRQVRQPQLTILPPPAKGKKKTVRQLMKEEMPGDESIDHTHIDPWIQMEFQSCVRSVERQEKYQPGNRNNFIFTLGNKCYRKNLPEEVAAVLAQKQFGAPDLDAASIVRNAYHYTTRTDHQEEEKKKPVAVRIIEFMTQQYEVRRNVIQGRLEFREKNKGGKNEFCSMKKEDYNTVFYDLQMAGIPCHPSTVKSLIDSRYAQNFNPFEAYFYGLKPYDGQTDYIALLAATVKTTNQPFWEDCLKRWLVGMVACALDDKIENQLAIIMKGEQGKGKSSWIRHLLPPELSKYYRNGMINPENKDHMLFLSQCLLINLEEFEGMTGRSISELKRLIVQDVVTERRPFDTDANSYIRHCSFIASTNEPRFLKDPAGAFRRYPTVTVEEIDYHAPVNHAGIYSQALYLWKNGFHYWYENEEIATLNEVNRKYSLASIEEELLYVYFRKPKADDLDVKWMPVSAILVLISMNGKIQMNDRNQKSLVQILERDNFRKRISENKIYEYEVVQYSFDEVDRNYKKTLSTGPKETQEELPF